KSRLIAEFVAIGGRDSSGLVAVAAAPGGRVTPFSLLVELLQAWLNLPPGRGESARARLTRRSRHILAQSHVEAGDIDEVVGTLELAMELRDGAPIVAPGASFNIRDRVVGALHALRRAQAVDHTPIIWMIEDIHFADASSIEVLRRLQPEPGEQSHLLILTGIGDGLAAAQLRVWADEGVELGALSGPALSERLRDRLGGAGSDRAVSAIAERTGGNPLLVEQLALETRDAGEIPPTARAVVTARVDRLSPTAKAVLQHAAVAGRRFRAPILEELFGREIAAELEELCDEALLQHDESQAGSSYGGEYAFAVGLVREVVYQSLSVSARQGTHLRIGELLATRYRAGRDEPPVTIAEHFELGGRMSSASAFWLRAGLLALAANDAAAAVTHFSRTLATEDQRGDEGRSEASHARQREALIGRERAYHQLGEPEAQARDLARLERLAARDPALMAAVKNRAATRLLRLGDYGGAVAASERAEEAARNSDDELGLGEALRL
ncbi:MAG: hypothetical protein AAGC55_26420, partial [Myxococcota bacterium]